MCVGMYSPSLDHAAAKGVRRARRLRETTDSFMIACRCGVDWCVFRRGWAPTSPGECWCWRQWALKGVDLEIRSCDLYTALIYRSFFWSEAVPSRAPLHLFVSGWLSHKLLGRGRAQGPSFSSPQRTLNINHRLADFVNGKGLPSFTFRGRPTRVIPCGCESVPGCCSERCVLRA